MAVRGLKVSAVLLDALGTLVELEPPAPRLAAELRGRFGLEVSLPQAERAIGVEIAHYRAHLDEGRNAAGLAALRARCAQVLADELEVVLGQSVPTGPAMVEAMLASLRFNLFADVPEALAELRRLGVRLVVVSNWDVSLSEVLERLGVTRWLDGVVTSAEVGARKPDRAVFERGLAVAGVGAGQAVHVGDSPEEDVRGALRAGIEAILISRDGRDLHAPDAVHTTIRSLRELPPLLCA
jgi:putative hydrolase of the HAD superfamily